MEKQRENRDEIPKFPLDKKQIIFVPDNLRSGVSQPCRYEPLITRSYEDCAAHYGAAVIPARIRRPQDKSKAELGIKGIQNQLLARLRNRTFFSLSELNQALAGLLVEYNRRSFQKLEGSGPASPTWVSPVPLRIERVLCRRCTTISVFSRKHRHTNPRWTRFAPDKHGVSSLRG